MSIIKASALTLHRGSTGKDPQVLQNLPLHLKQQLHLGQRADKHSSSLGGEKYILKIE
jgi:hypothetical protein